MEYKQKQNMQITGFLPALISIIIFISISIIWDVSTGFYVLGSIMLFYSLLILYSFYRTRNWGSLLSTIYMILYGSLLLSMAPNVIIGERIYFSTSSIVLLIATILIFDCLLYLNFKRKLKWRGKEILELAAMNVEEAKNNFTERPLPTGIVNFSRNHLEAFARFFQKRLLGLCYFEETRIVFMPLKYKNEYFALFNPNYNYHEKTWIAFNDNGKVSVNVSKADYLDYKEDLDFEQLCNSLNDLMIEFINLHIDGREIRIIDKLDNL